MAGTKRGTQSSASETQNSTRSGASGTHRLLEAIVHGSVRSDPPVNTKRSATVATSTSKSTSKPTLKAATTSTTTTTAAAAAATAAAASTTTSGRQKRVLTSTSSTKATLDTTSSSRKKAKADKAPIFEEVVEVEDLVDNESSSMSIASVSDDEREQGSNSGVSSEIGDNDASSENDIESMYDDGTFLVTVIVTAGLDPFNNDDETYVDLKVTKETLISDINDRIIATLDLHRGDGLFYCRSTDLKDKKTKIDITSTVGSLGLQHKDELVLDAIRQKKPITKQNKSSKFASVDHPIELICVSRIGVSDKIVRRVKVIVRPNDYVNDVMFELGNHFERAGLKFKCGRTVLKEDKTFHELGVMHGSQIVVTGGRL